MANEQSAAVNPTRAFYDRISKRYDAIADAWEHASRQKGVEALAVGRGEEVLEIGYGTGHALVQFARAGAEVVGIELSEGMRSVARDRVTKEGLASSVRLDLGDARTLPYEDGRFDAAFMSYALELFAPDEIPEVLAEVRRVLRAGGRLGIVALAEKDHPSFMSELYKWLHEHFPHLVDCRPIDAVALLRKAGFRIREAIGMSIWGLPVVAVLAIKPDGAFF